ncbi:response regulator [Aliiroseovarius sp. YM-037]|uniref:response regulator n=1 Tax=Aliiroseovarius sp. YM-037 TaxID=3341728 RepID=UPI003A812A20
MTTRVLVADDHPIFRDGLVKSLEETGEFRVVATASSADEAVAMAKARSPDLALLDLSMPGNGLSALAEILAAKSAEHVAMLTVSEEDDDVGKALQSGASAYILKGVSATELRRILNGVVAGEAYVSPGLAARVLSLMTSPKPSTETSPFDDLTKREVEILQLVSKSLSNKEVARELHIQEKTVKHHMTTIMSKLQARNRVEAALMARDQWGRDR